jgi:hypothetical protein
LPPSFGKQRRENVPVFFGNTHTSSTGPRTLEAVP